MRKMHFNLGITMIEVVIAGVLFLAFTIPLMTLLNTSKFTNKRQESRTQAFLLAQSLMEEFQHNTEQFNTAMRRYPYLQLPGYQVKYILKPFADQVTSDGLMILEINVAWKALNKSHQLTLSSLISTAPAFYKFSR